MTISKKAEQFYFESFEKILDDEVAYQEKSKKLKNDFKTSDETEFLEDILGEIAEEAEKAAGILYATKSSTPKKNKRPFFEADEDEDETSAEPVKDEEAPTEEDEPLDEPKDENENEDDLDEVDEILSKIDLSSIDNSVKLELIRSIIDAAQNQASPDDELQFDDFVSNLIDVIDEFQFEEPSEEGEVGTGEEEIPVEGEEEPTGEEEIPVEGEEEPTGEEEEIPAEEDEVVEEKKIGKK